MDKKCLNQTRKCIQCHKTFSTLTNLNKHIRRVHFEEPNPTIFEGNAKKYKCMEGCDVSFQCNTNLREHLERFHQISNEMESLMFKTYSDFIKWLQKEEERNHVQYIRVTGKKKQKCVFNKNRVENTIEKIYYECRRSIDNNVYHKQHLPSTKTRKRRQKTHGSCKLLCSCTSQIILSRHTATDKCFVQYFKTHYKHDNSTNHLRLRKADRDAVASKLILGVSTSEILDSVKQTVSDNQRQISRKDIYNIKAALNNNYRYLNEISESDSVESCETSQLLEEIELIALKIINDIKMKIFSQEQLESMRDHLKTASAVNSLGTLSTIDIDSTQNSQDTYELTSDKKEEIMEVQINTNSNENIQIVESNVQNSFNQLKVKTETLGTLSNDKGVKQEIEPDSDYSFTINNIIKSLRPNSKNTTECTASYINVTNKNFPVRNLKYKQYGFKKEKICPTKTLNCNEIDVSDLIHIKNIDTNILIQKREQNLNTQILNQNSCISSENTSWETLQSFYNDHNYAICT